MGIAINYHLNKSKRTKGAKTVAIIGRVSYSFMSNEGHQKRTFKFGTGNSAPVNGFKRGRVSSAATDASHINSKLTAFTKRAEDLYKEYESKKSFPTESAFKEALLSGVILAKEDRNFVSDFEGFIAYHENKGSAQTTVRNLKQTLEHLKSAAVKKRHPLDYATMNLEFYAKFISYCSEVVLPGETKGLKKNTIGSHIKLLKTFMNYATACGWNTFSYYRHPQFKILVEKIPVTTLNEIEISQLYEIDLSKRPRLALNLHFFLLGCETGLRYVDYSKIKKDKISEVTGGYNLSAKTQKTGTDVIIPLSRLAMDILAKYNYQMPKAPSNQTLNFNLRELMKLAEINKQISSHDARRSFATNQYKAGTPVQWIMKITGHATEREFYKYIGVDLAENADLVRGMHDKYKIERKGLLNTTLKIA
ncbi:MAG: tyrosine-type recombinase/integrase [Chitinophagales bacterium]|nr:tyrosine-type recombinase/integrase [Chitinophagales bacterium]